MILDFQQPLADTIQQFAKRRVSREVGPQRVKVDQKTEQGCQLVSVSVGEGNSEHHVILARVTIKQSVEGGGQRHEEADVFASTETANSFREIPSEREDPLFTSVRERFRTRPFRRQVEPIGCPVEVFFPEGRFLRKLVTRNLLLLPGGVVSVLEQWSG